MGDMDEVEVQDAAGDALAKLRGVRQLLDAAAGCSDDFPIGRDGCALLAEQVGEACDLIEPLARR